MEEIRIRPVRKRDLAEIGAIAEKAGKGEMLPSTLSFELQADPETRTPSSAAFVAEAVRGSSRRLVGTGSIVREKGERFLLSNLFVHPEYRRRGIAERLLKEHLRHAFDRWNAERVVAIPVSAAAREAVKKLGFSTDRFGRVFLDRKKYLESSAPERA